MFLYVYTCKLSVANIIGSIRHSNVEKSTDGIKSHLHWQWLVKETAERKRRTQT